MLCWSVVWLFDRMVTLCDWLIVWCFGSLVGWLVGFLVVYFVEFVEWFSDCVVSLFGVWLIG